MTLLEAVPNFSEGCRPAVIDELAEALASGGATVADVHSDADHNRSVFTLFGAPAQLEAGLVQAIGIAVVHIDLGVHQGVHPRVGACDVVPVVPLDDFVAGGGDMAAAIALARTLAGLIGDAWQVPTLLYGAASGRVGGSAGGDKPSGASFAGQLRAGGSAGLAARLAAGDATVHAGPVAAHPTAGVTLVGARPVLVACNVELASDDLELARAVARAVRERDDGLPGVRALGLPLATRGSVQVSANIERWRECGPERLLAEVVERAPVARFELVGLLPEAAWKRLAERARMLSVPITAPQHPTIEHHARDAARRLR